ncbi:UNVERIFIED_CONTAM: variable surface lipoprotein [Campylobacter lari]
MKNKLLKLSLVSTISFVPVMAISCRNQLEDNSFPFANLDQLKVKDVFKNIYSLEELKTYTIQKMVYDYNHKLLEINIPNIRLFNVNTSKTNIRMNIGGK